MRRLKECKIIVNDVVARLIECYSATVKIQGNSVILEIEFGDSKNAERLFNLITNAGKR